MRRSNRSAPLALALGAILGCQPAAERTDTAAMADTGARGTTAAAVARTDTGAAAAGPIHTTLTEWRIGLARATLPAGGVTLHAMNQGRYQHALEVEGGGREWKTDPIRAGGEATLQADLQPGTYEVYCPIVDTHGNHRQLGMRTTLVVR